MTRQERAQLWDEYPHVVMEAPVCLTRRSVRCVSAFLHATISEDPENWWRDRESALSQYRAFLVNNGYTPSRLGVDLKGEAAKMLSVCLFEVSIMGDDFYSRTSF